MSYRVLAVAVALSLAAIAPDAAAVTVSSNEGSRAAALAAARQTVMEMTEARAAIHPTVLGGGIGVGAPNTAQGIGAAACYLAGVSVLSEPRAVAVLTVLQSCSFDGVNVLPTEVPCPGSACVGGGANFIPPPGGVRNACASGYVVFLVQDGTTETIPGGGCGPI